MTVLVNRAVRLLIILYWLSLFSCCNATNASSSFFLTEENFTNAPEPTACNCYCAPVITVSCPAPAPPPTCQPTTDYPTATPDSSTADPATTASTAATEPTSTSSIRTTTPNIVSSSTITVFPTSTSTTMQSSTTAPTITVSTSPASTSTTPTMPSSSTPTTAGSSTSTETSTSTILSTSTSPTSTQSTTTQATPSTTTTGSTSRITSATFPPSSTLPSNRNCPSSDLSLSPNSGWFASPNHPQNYNDDANCAWTINAASSVVITFSSFNTESGNDFIEIAEWTPSGSSLLLRTSGNITPQPVYSQSALVFVTFTSDGSIVSSGFNASFAINNQTTVKPGGTDPTGVTRPTTSGPILDNCQALLQEDSGTFSSPYFPQEYPNNANCSWLITANERVTIRFHSFRMESPNDVVKIYDGPTTSSNRLLQATGNSIPNQVTSNGRQVLITFTTDSSVTDIGFNASYSLYIPVTTTAPPYYYCGENKTITSSGFIESPNFPYGYPAYSRCTWYIQSPPGTTIQFHFTDFSTKSGDTVQVFSPAACSYNYPVISLSGSVSSTCGFVSTSNTMKITFSSGATSSDSYRGFRASFTTDHGCGETLNSTEGTIATPGYDINGTFSYSCQWKINANQGSKVNVSFTEHIGTGQSIGVYDGNSTGRILASLGGPTTPLFVVSQSNQLLVTASSISSSYEISCPSSSSYTNGVCKDGNNAKWKATYTAVSTPTYGCYGRMNTETRMVSSPGHPSSYTQRSLACTWRIAGPVDKNIELTFPVPINLYKDSRYSYYHDTFTISQGPWNFNLYGGTIHPLPMQIASNETTFYFSTYSSIDNATLYSGWNITWRVIDRLN